MERERSVEKVAAATATATETETTTTVYFFLSHITGTMAHTLFAIPIPIPISVPMDYRNPNPNPNPDPNFNPNRRIIEMGDAAIEERLDPILEFPASEYPRMMSWAQLGSCFYFLGGELQPPKPDVDYETYIYNSINNVGWNLKPIFPTDVYMFDASSSFSKKNLIKLEFGMSSGKPLAYLFVADGKLFVLARSQGESVGNIKKCRSEYNMIINLLEVYDPEKGNWKVLDDPPVEDPLTWSAHCIEGCGRKVYVYCLQTGYRDFLMLVFNLDTYTWIRLRRVSASSRLPRGLCLGDTIYRTDSSGLLAQSFKVRAQNESHSEVEEPDLEFDPNQRLFVAPGGLGHLRNRGFCHLGNRHFCYVHTDSLLFSSSDSQAFNPYRRYISVGVIREIREKPTTLRAELLYSAYFLVESTYFIDGDINRCFPVSTPVNKCHTPLRKPKSYADKCKRKGPLKPEN